MASYIVTVSALWVDGVKVRRGEIVELDNPEHYGTRVELYTVPAAADVEEKPKRKRRTKAEMEAAGDED